MVSKAPLAQPAYNSAGWNTPLNSNFNILTDALGAITSVAVTTTNVVLTAAQAQTAGLSVSGTLTGNRSVLLPQNCVGFWFLSVSTAGGFDVSIYADNGAGSPAGTGITPVAGYLYTIYSDGTNVGYAVSNIVRKSGDTMTGALALPSNGLNVGSGQLQVSGGNVTTTGQFTSANNVTAYSDERLKENIATITNSLERIRGMRGVTFKMKETGSVGAGVIAQEVQKTLPEVVYEDETGYLHVAYGNIVSVLIEGVKELERRVVYLEAKK